MRLHRLLSFGRENYKDLIHYPLLPPMAPSRVRMELEVRSIRRMADMLVKIWLSLFHFSKIMKLAKRVDFSTFASIVSPWKDPEKVVQAVNRLPETLPQLVGRYLPWVFVSSFLEVPLIKKIEANSPLSLTVTRELDEFTFPFVQYKKNL